MSEETKCRGIWSSGRTFVHICAMQNVDSTRDLILRSQYFTPVVDHLPHPCEPAETRLAILARHGRSADRMLRYPCVQAPTGVARDPSR